ncbi:MULTISPECIES: alpha-ketoglutarate-dependent dioxygenase AlkB [unclassified Streptomyces]|uniref:alpha-ketoglutarate-dependent dioxygenase AlkB n=1 Tax=unclassified Streptomyces TaxID=2593676 RepID=UPI002E19BD85|nr:MULTISPECIES: alpha-ketoglutarate-dependent dioxygenase AlkB [unclassified Streptomyces]
MLPGPRISDEIFSCTLPTDENLFAELSASVCWEDVGKGRQGAALTKVDDETGDVPVVRTTAQYGSPTQRFQAVHERLAHQIQEYAELPVTFNNAVIERYTNAYTKMGSHSDQALDLADESFIAVFSCYRNPESGPPRKLIFETKQHGDEKLEIPLDHHSIVVFSIAANRRLKHRIVLDAPGQAADNQWLGVTFRTAKTFLRFSDRIPYLPQGTRLALADEEQRRDFFRRRRRENTETDFVYPSLTYTVSEGDLMPPEELET